MKAIILNYASSCVETAVLPDELTTTEQIENYLDSVYDYKLSEIAYMVCNREDDLVPVFEAGEYTTSLFI